MTSGGGGFFHRFTPWGRGGGGAPGGHQGGGSGRGDYHPRLQGPGEGRRGVSFEDSSGYDFADNGRNLCGENQYPLRRAFSDAEYEARRNSIFHPDGTPPTNNEARGPIPPSGTTWHGHQDAGLHPTMNLPGSQGQQGWSITLGPPAVRQMSMPGLQGQQGQSPTTGPPGGGQIPMPVAVTPQAMAAPQGGAQIAVHPPGNNGGGVDWQGSPGNYLSRILGNLYGP